MSGVAVDILLHLCFSVTGHCESGLTVPGGGWAAAGGQPGGQAERQQCAAAAASTGAQRWPWADGGG